MGSQLSAVSEIGAVDLDCGCNSELQIGWNGRRGFAARWVISLRPIARHRSLRYDPGAWRRFSTFMQTALGGWLLGEIAPDGVGHGSDDCRAPRFAGENLGIGGVGNG
jgi:hypothetical protein